MNILHVHISNFTQSQNISSHIFSGITFGILSITQVFLNTYKIVFVKHKILINSWNARYFFFPSSFIPLKNPITAKITRHMFKGGILQKEITCFERFIPLFYAPPRCVLKTVSQGMNYRFSIDLSGNLNTFILS